MRGDLSLRCKERRNLRGPTMHQHPKGGPTTMPGFTTHYILGMKAYNDMPQNNLKFIMQIPLALPAWSSGTGYVFL